MAKDKVKTLSLKSSKTRKIRDKRVEMDLQESCFVSVERDFSADLDETCKSTQVDVSQEQNTLNKNRVAECSNTQEKLPLPETSLSKHKSIEALRKDDNLKRNSPTIRQMFSNQSQRKSKQVICPVCGKELLLSKINAHLDSECNGISSEVTQDTVKPVSNDSALSSKLTDLEQSQGEVANNSLEPAMHTCLTTKQHMGTAESKTGLGAPGTSTECAVTSSSSLVVIDNGHLEVTLESIADVEIKVEHTASSIRCSHTVSNNQRSKLSLKREQNKASENAYDNSPCRSSLKRKHNDEDSKNFQSVLSHPSNGNFVDNEPALTVQGDVDDVHRDPYYLANFQLIMDTVLANEDDRKLFNNDDNCVFETFKFLSREAKLVYIRLFQRKYGWFRIQKLDYPKISSDLIPFIDELVEKEFLERETNLTDLMVILSLLSGPEVKTLGIKQLHIPTFKGQSSKEYLVKSILEQCQKQKSVFGDRTKFVIQKAKSILGGCVHIAEFPRKVFCRLMLLFSLNLPLDDEENFTGQSLLSTVLLVNMGVLAYPAYTIERTTPTYSCRDDLLRYEEAYQRITELRTCLENGNLTVAHEQYLRCVENYKELLQNLKLDKVPAANLPKHLRKFTAERLFTKMADVGVEILQKLRKYEAAVDQLHALLGQEVFCTDSRGRWWDRLALNLDQHLKKPDKALDMIKLGLTDPCVRITGHRLALQQRVKKICESKSSKLSHRVAEFSIITLTPSKIVTIPGKKLPHTKLVNTSRFVTNGVDDQGDNVLTYCSVEELALSHYRQDGYIEGIHGEGGTFSTLFGILMWDVIFCDGVADVFRSPFQSAPLDIYCDSFYENRKDLIEQHLAEIREASTEELQEKLSLSWSTHEGQMCSAVNWDRFKSLQQAKDLLACIGGYAIAGICERFAKDSRHCRGGLPDLVVWNPTNNIYKMVEVKGPGDRLSTKQQIWLDVLDSLGVPVEVCHVKDVGAKKLRLSSF